MNSSLKEFQGGQHSSSLPHFHWSASRANSSKKPPSQPYFTWRSVPTTSSQKLSSRRERSETERPALTYAPLRRPDRTGNFCTRYETGGECSLAEETWTARQWNRPEKKDGLVIVLRRPKSPFTTMELDLHKLDPTATYQVEIRDTYDKQPTKEMKGSELSHLQVHLSQAPDSTLIFYQMK